MTPLEAHTIASAPLKFGVPIDQRRGSAMKMLDRARAIASTLARYPEANVAVEFGRLTRTALDYTLRYPEYCPVAYAWWEYIQAEAERRKREAN